jgi:hypothetical protein
LGRAMTKKWSAKLFNCTGIKKVQVDFRLLPKGMRGTLEP